jgi:REP element-mobilizing transposase RayT
MKSYARTPPRLHWVFSRSPLFFVTCCTYRRLPILAQAEVHAALINFANRADGDFGITVGRYVILPDHIHLFVAGPDDFKFGKMGRHFKAFSRQGDNHKQVARSDLAARFLRSSLEK